MATTNKITTRFFVISDTHGSWPVHPVPDDVDVLIHCGDLTQESKLEEYRRTIKYLKESKAPLKLVIAGNHDWTLDIPMFKKKVAEVAQIVEPELIEKTYGYYGQIQQIFEDATAHGIFLLSEGTHQFDLANGSRIKVYASPYTQSTNDWGFQFSNDEDHVWQMEEDTDIVITHGPPRGILDRTASKKRIGSPGLFKAVASVKPLVHCFGHVHEGWGGYLASWRTPHESVEINHFSAIDHSASKSLATVSAGRLEGTVDNSAAADSMPFQSKQVQYRFVEHHRLEERKMSSSPTTLFLNAATTGDVDTMFHQVPWLVEIVLHSNER